MTPSRRGIFKLLAVAPLAGKQAAETAAQNLAGMVRGIHGMPQPDLANAIGLSAGVNECAPPSVEGGFRLTRELRDAALRAALQTKAGRTEIESILYEMHRQVGPLDVDLAANRSYSLAAKVCYQRQRNVARSLSENVLERSAWQRMHEWGERICSIAGFKLNG